MGFKSNFVLYSLHSQIILAYKLCEELNLNKVYIFDNSDTFEDVLLSRNKIIYLKKDNNYAFLFRIAQITLNIKKYKFFLNQINKNFLKKNGLQIPNFIINEDIIGLFLIFTNK